MCNCSHCQKRETEVLVCVNKNNSILSFDVFTVYIVIEQNVLCIARLWLLECPLGREWVSHMTVKAPNVTEREPTTHSAWPWVLCCSDRSLLTAHLSWLLFLSLEKYCFATIHYNSTTAALVKSMIGFIAVASKYFLSLWTKSFRCSCQCGVVLTEAHLSSTLWYN